MVFSLLLYLQQSLYKETDEAKVGVFEVATLSLSLSLTGIAYTNV